MGGMTGVFYLPQHRHPVEGTTNLTSHATNIQLRCLALMKSAWTGNQTWDLQMTSGQCATNCSLAEPIEDKKR